MTEASPQQQLSELAKRPDIETVLKKYERIRSELRQRLTAEVGLPGNWEQPHSEAENPCAEPYSNVRDAVSVNMATWVNSGQIADGKWPKAQDLFREITGKNGFGDLRVVVDSPGDHLIRTYDEHGGEMSFGTKKSTILSAGTGCHLTEDAHPGTATRENGGM